MDHLKHVTLEVVVFGINSDLESLILGILILEEVDAACISTYTVLISVSGYCTDTPISSQIHTSYGSKLSYCLDVPTNNSRELR